MDDWWYLILNFLDRSCPIVLLIFLMWLLLDHFIYCVSVLDCFDFIGNMNDYMMTGKNYFHHKNIITNRKKNYQKFFRISHSFQLCNEYWGDQIFKMVLEKTNFKYTRVNIKIFIVWKYFMLFNFFSMNKWSEKIFHS